MGGGHWFICFFIQSSFIEYLLCIKLWEQNYQYQSDLYRKYSSTEGEKKLNFKISWLLQSRIE